MIISHHQFQVAQTVLPYHQLMTPKWMVKNAVITGPHALYPQYFEVLPTTGVFGQRALQIIIPLLASNILKSTDSVTVTMTVAVDVSYANNNDHDPHIGIRDGQSFIGIHATDGGGYRLSEADSNTVLANIKYNNGPSSTS